MSEKKIQLYPFPRTQPRSEVFEVRLDGAPAEVLHTATCDFVLFSYDPSLGPVEVSVELLAGRSGKAEIRPRKHRLPVEGGAHEFRFELKGNEKLSFEADGCKPLFIWPNEPEVNKPDPEDPKVHYFAGGQIHEVGRFEIGSGETIYLEGGAVVKGCFRAFDAKGVAVRGHGILDGSYYRRERGESTRSIIFGNCEGVTVEDITMINPSTWMCVPAACRQVRIRNLKQIGECVGSDGIDIVGCQDVTIRDCFLRNNDDCVVVKAHLLGRNKTGPDNVDGRVDPKDILVEDCVFLNDRAGNAIEIGHELSVDRVSDITFRDIDILSVHGHGAAFSIHAFDRSSVEDIVFEEIRVEHCYDKFIDFRVSKSRYSSDQEPGRIRRITLRNVDWEVDPVNLGYTVSIISGWDEEHQAEDIFFENVSFSGRKVKSLNEFEFHSRFARNFHLK